MQHIAIQYYKTPLGELILGSWGKRLCLCDWKERKDRGQIDKRLRQGLQASFREQSSRVIDEAIVLIANYLDGKIMDLQVPLKLIGTDFQLRVWSAIRSIPYGESLSYSKLAMRLEQPRAIRAVATAVGANAISLFIPCHRVVGEDGSLTGYAGGVAAKRSLLQMESHSINQQYQLFQ